MNRILLFVCGAILLTLVDSGFSQGSAFLYQGQLAANGSPANGSYDFTFTLFQAGAPTAGTLTNSATAVSDGLFSVALDFGPAVFNGSDLWLQIGVRTNGGAGFTLLAPMQPILPSPYAIMAGAANTANTANALSGPLAPAQLSGAYPGNVILDNAANSFAGSFSGDGSGLANVDAVSLNGLGGSKYAPLNALTNYATLDVLINYATLDALSKYATLDALTNYATLASISNAPGGSTGGSSIPNIQVFDSPGAFQFTVPANVTRIAVEVWGGGGGGGTSTSYTTYGSGGGGGGYGKGVFAMTPGTGYAVVVGSGGGAASAGGASNFGSLISASGGAGGANVQTIGVGGTGGSSTAPINITGGTGQWMSSFGGNAGGNAGMGGSGGPGDTGSGGGNGQAPGGGGGGGANDPGGSGGNGRVIVYY